MNTDNKIKRLHKKRHALMCDGLDTLESISVLEDITEIYVLENRDECALNCYKEYIYQLERIVGPETLSRDYRSKLIFLKELQVVAANFNDKITLCRDFVYDVFEYCGINSRAGLHAIELFFVCCYDTGETEELNLFCKEIADKLSDSATEEGKSLCFLCQNFDTIQYGSVEDRQKLLALATEIFGKKSLIVAEIKRDLAKYYCDDRAFGLLNEAYEIHCDISGNNSAFALSTEFDIAIALLKKEDYKNALAVARKLYKKSRAINYNNFKIPDAPKALALALFFNDKKAESLKYFEKAYLLYKEHYTYDIDRSNILFLYGAVLVETGEYNRGFELLNEYSEKTLLLLYKAFLSDSVEKAVKSAVNLQKKFYDSYIIFASDSVMGDINKTEKFYDIICKYKTFIYDCEFLRTLFYRDDVHGTVLRNLNNQLKTETSPEKVLLIQKDILKYLKQYDYVRYFESTDINVIKHALNDDEVLIDFYYCKTRSKGYYLPIRIKTGDVEICQKIPEEKINTAIKEISDIVISKKKELPQNPFENLFNGNEKRIYISIDGELYKIPFELFVDDNITVSYLTSAKDITKRKDADSDSIIKSLSVFAAPDTDNTDSNDERSNFSGLLSGSLAEALLISKIFPNKVKLYTKENATKSALLDKFNSDILHIASHATEENGGTIYLSGGDSGKITCQQIAKSDMSSVRLAVLSCCKTGGSEYIRYFGTNGIRRAFTLAGAKDVLTSFWDIDDIVTAVFMHRFYSFLSDGLSPCMALSETKTYLKNITALRFSQDDLVALSDTLIQANLKDVYRTLRDYCSSVDDDEKLFSSPYYWAGFAFFG